MRNNRVVDNFQVGQALDKFQVGQALDNFQVGQALEICIQGYRVIENLLVE